jgi:hypothetical protein
MLFPVADQDALEAVECLKRAVACKTPVPPSKSFSAEICSMIRLVVKLSVDHGHSIMDHAGRSNVACRLQANLAHHEPLLIDAMLDEQQ